MKKVLFFVLAIVLVFSFVACTQQSAPATEETSDAQAEEATDPAETAAAASEEEAKTVYLACCIRSTESEYWNQEAQGCKIFAEATPGVELTVLECGEDEEEQINQIKTFIAAHGEDSIIYVDSQSNANTATIAEICEENKVYFVSAWPIDSSAINPGDYKYWVLHQWVYGGTQGYDLAVKLFDKMGGKGKVLGLGGSTADNGANERYAGLLKALEEYPEVELVEFQVAHWDMQEALEITEAWLGKYSEVDAIWCAGDAMALGAIEALKAKGLNGKVLVCGVDGMSSAVQAILDGDMYATYSNDGFVQGAYGAAWAYAAWSGKINTADMEAKEKLIYTNDYLVTPDNAQDFYDTHVAALPEYDFTDLSALIKAYVADVDAQAVVYGE